MTDDTRIDKIQKLLAKAERASTPEEGETFYAKAQELMAKWAIDDAMLRANKQSSDDKVTSKQITINKSKLWKSLVTLVDQIARANDVRAVYTDPGPGQKPFVTLVGVHQ